MSSLANDEAIMATNDDAASCKRFAIQLGYWKDPFLEHFVKAAERKAPEINRGYFARVAGIKLLIDQFIEKTGMNCQIVNLGAGFDTLFWRLKLEKVNIKSFVDVDFPAVTSRKIHYIKNRKFLLDLLVQEDDEVQYSSSEMHCGNYHLVGGDLRELSELAGRLLPLLDSTLPTLFLAECLLVYLDTQHSRALLRWITSQFASPLFINYEQINIDDKFGHVMVDNLKKRSCTLFGTSSCKSIDTQKNRYMFLAEGWEEAKVWDMVKVYNSLPRIEVERVERLEFLDETELLHQLLQHYCIVVAYKGDSPELQLNTIGFT
ncbi:LCMT1 [Cordylochernes scorpioides]|uniref:Leucine carboxyl methyltransferase 1 n=1 Tax=Cordylochernes scorpioides TaxID=51811 RepID=A0ABY6LIQ2_9ARAC|nr:LCMT1 [Cordylochernes scorpioides]